MIAASRLRTISPRLKISLLFVWDFWLVAVKSGAPSNGCSQPFCSVQAPLVQKSPTVRFPGRPLYPTLPKSVAWPGPARPSPAGTATSEVSIYGPVLWRVLPNKMPIPEKGGMNCIFALKNLERKSFSEISRLLCFRAAEWRAAEIQPEAN